MASIDPALGGPPECIREISSAMARAGVESDVLSLQAFNPEWLNRWQVPVTALGANVGRYSYCPRFFGWLEEQRAKYDAILVHGIWQYHSIGVWRFCRKFGVPYFLFTNGMLDPWFAQAYPLKHLKKATYWALFEHRVLRDARCVLFQSEEEALLAARSFRPYTCSEKVIGLGTAEPPDDDGSHVRSFFDAFPDLKDRRIVLFLSRLHKKKGCDLLIHSFARAASLEQRLHLVIAGPDEEDLRPKLERLAAECQVRDRVTFAGYLSTPAKWGAFRVAEAFALTSHSENYGNAIVEAMACRVPVLITNKVNIWREIARDRAGLVENDDVEGASKLFMQWLQLGAVERRILGQNARRCYESRFEINSFTRRLVSFVDDQISVTRAKSAMQELPIGSSESC